MRGGFEVRHAWHAQIECAWYFLHSANVRMRATWLSARIASME
jgi:hypothetical protein